jgi:ferrous iron transport protein B
MSSCHGGGDTVAQTRGQAVIALAGNPNCGKTTLFNLLTGARQHVGNWPGVTVERREGQITLGPRKALAVDLPGVYSLVGGGGIDQSVARDFLLDQPVDLILNIVDASNLERHLALTAELLEIGRPMVLVLNMIDEARAQGMQPELDKLSRLLDLPVIPMVARKGLGRDELMAAIAVALNRPRPTHPQAHGPDIEAALTRLAGLIPDGGPARRRFDALRLLSGTSEPATESLARSLARTWEEIGTGGIAATPRDRVADERFHWAANIARATLPAGERTGLGRRVTAALDRVVLSDVLGVPIFLAVLYMVFVVSFSGGNIFLNFFDQASLAILQAGLGHVLLMIGLPDRAVSVIAGGIGGGLNLVITFIPPIGLTFLFLALLDDSGYMARAAYAMDRLMRRFGLPGNALVPMVIGFGCNVPAILGSRIVEDPRGRFLTVLIQPFMSCSARLTVYMAFAVVLFRGNGGQVVFLLYLLGIVVAMLTALLLGRTALSGRPMPFVMELPPYRLPAPRSVLVQSWQRLKVFMFRVGRVIAAIGLLLFILPGFGWTGHGLAATDINHSLLAQGSRGLAPLFTPMGLKRDNWPAVSGLIAGAAAKEVVIGTLNGIYQRQSLDDLMAQYRHPDVLGRLEAAFATIPAGAKTFITSLGDPLGLRQLSDSGATLRASGASSATLKALATDFTPLSAFAYLVFVLLYVPCASTMGALRREVGWGWTLFSISYGIFLAWGAATAVYQGGTFAQHPGSSAAWIAGVLAALAALILGLRYYGRRHPPVWAEPGTPTCGACAGCGTGTAPQH